MHTTKFSGEDSVKNWLMFKNLTIVFIIQVFQL